MVGGGVAMVVVEKLWEAQRRGGVDFWVFFFNGSSHA